MIEKLLYQSLRRVSPNALALWYYKKWRSTRAFFSYSVA